MFNQATNKLYFRARDRGRRSQLWSVLTKRSRCLLALDEIKAACTVRARYEARIQTVAIRQIRGSENRASDFDRDFNPLRNHNQGRWMNIASARLRGKALPPVELVQVGDVYFVRDGHHRISVAQALGQLEIEANVVVWQLKGPLPWETSARTQDPTGYPSLRDLVMAVGARLRVQMTS